MLPNLPLKDILKSDILTEIYKDIAKPGVSAIGKSLGTVFELSNTILLPIKLINEKTKLKFEKHLENYRKKLLLTDEKEIVPISTEIGIPILEKLTYVEDENISELYINFLANAASSKTASLVHPSFIKIIDCISSDEAKIINFLLKKQYDREFLDIKYIYFRARLTSGQGGKNFSNPLFEIPNNLHLTYASNINVYFDNLIKQGLLIDKAPSALIDSYSDLEKRFKNLYDKTNEKLSAEYKNLTIEKSYLQVTNYGALFLESCLVQFEKMLIKANDLQKAENIDEAIDIYESMLSLGFYPRAIILNLLEFYLIKNRINDYTKLKSESEEIFKNDREKILEKYFQSLYFYNLKNLKELNIIKAEILQIHQSVEKNLKIEWEFTDLDIFLTKELESELKIQFKEIINYLKEFT